MLYLLALRVYLFALFRLYICCLTNTVWSMRNPPVNAILNEQFKLGCTALFSGQVQIAYSELMRDFNMSDKHQSKIFWSPSRQ